MFILGVLVVSTLSVLAGCDLQPTEQLQCLEYDMFLRTGECVDWNAIPIREQVEIIQATANEISEVRGIPQTEANEIVINIVKRLER